MMGRIEKQEGVAAPKRPQEREPQNHRQRRYGDGRAIAKKKRALEWGKPHFYVQARIERISAPQALSPS
jgi:hypothetical protein